MLEFHVRVSRGVARLFIVAAVAVVIVVAVSWALAHRSRSDAQADSTAATSPAVGLKGPWGRIAVTDVMLDLPEEFVQLPATNGPPLRWHFPGMRRDEVLALLQGTDLPPSVLAMFNNSSRWIPEDDGVALEPTDAMVLQLTRQARSILYPLLIRAEINHAELDPVWFRPDTFQAQVKGSELRPDSIALLNRLTYTQENTRVMLFADRQVALRQLPDDRERRLFLQALGRKPAVRVRLAVDDNADIEDLAGYWGAGGRRKDVFPLLKSFQRTEGDRELSIISLVPPFIRERVWTYPFPSSNTNLVRQDCFWSAFNTFNETTDDRLGDMAYLREVLDRDYYSIQRPSQLGDIILLTTPAQAAVHAAVYIAGDIVFTKNGFHYTQPWIFSRMDDMLQTYLARYPGAKALVPQYFRRKGI